MTIGGNDLTKPCPIELITKEVCEEVLDIIQKYKPSKEIERLLRDKYVIPYLIKKLDEI